MTCPKYPKIDTLYTRDEKFKATAEVRRPEFLIPRKWLVTEKIHGCNIRVSLEQRDFDISGRKENSWLMQINGRNDNSQIPPNLLRHLQETFTLEGLKSLWRCKNNCEECGGEGWTDNTDEGRVFCPRLDSYSITLYGEGYGGGIQKGGGQYTSKTKGGAVSFRLFDVLVGEKNWLRRADVEDVAEKLGIKTVPLIYPPTPIPMTIAQPASQRINLGGVMVTYEEQPWSLKTIAEFVKNGITSIVGWEEGTLGHQAEGVVAFTAEPLYNNRGQRLMFKLKTEDFA